MITIEMAPELFDDEVFDRNGEKIGKVGQVYVDNTSGQPTWATVRTGLFGLKESFVPLQRASVEGNSLRVPITKDQVKGAPRVDADDQEISPHAEQELYDYYGLTYLPSHDGDGTGERAGFRDGPARPGPRADRRADGIADRRTPDGDGTMTRSEERLNVGKERTEAGRVRLRKYVVTENQQLTVPLSHEEMRLERTPVDPADRGRLADAELGEAEHVETLHAERPVVTTETTPVEQVRLTKQNVTDRQTVTGDVRKERIEVDDEAGLVADPERRRDPEAGLLTDQELEQRDRRRPGI